MIIAVEGIDCAGKGEVCPRLATVLKGVLYKTPPESMRKEQDRINAAANDLLAAYLRRHLLRPQKYISHTVPSATPK